MMLKTHIVHLWVDGQNAEHVARFADLVDKARNDGTRDVRKVEFFVTSIAGRTGTAMTAILTYIDRQADS